MLLAEASDALDSRNGFVPIRRVRLAAGRPVRTPEGRVSGPHGASAVRAEGEDGDGDGEPMGWLAHPAQFDRRLEAALHRARAAHVRHVLLRVDVDTGSDAVLAGVVAVLGSLLREGDIMTRFDRAGIALLMEDCDLSDGLRVARILRALLRLREGPQGVEPPPVLSIGVVEIDGRGADAEELRRRAAEACGAAQRRGVNQIQVHEPGRAR